MKPSLAAVAILFALSGACSKPPAAPAPLPTTSVDLTGTIWTGYIRIDACSSSPGCPNFVGALYPFTLTISRGATVEAAIAGSTPENYTATLPGTIQADGAHVFSGLSTNGRVEIRELRIRKDRDAVITGTIDYISNRNSGDQRTLSGVIPSATLQRDMQQPGSAGSQTIAGTWSGKGRTDTCTGPICGVAPSTIRDFTITIVDSGQRITALLDSDLWARKVMDLEGTRQGDGSVRFVGLWTDPPTRAGEFRPFTVRTDPERGLTGEFEWVETAPTGTTRRTGVITSASRYVVLRSPGPFQGEWRGEYLPRTCSGDCSVVSFGTPSSFSVVLNQVGPAVSGRVVPSQGVAVQGSAAGNAVTLDGDTIVEPCLWDWEGSTICTQRVRRLEAHLDEYGRLTGTFELFREGWQGKLHYRYTITAELRNVVHRIQ